ncbi:MAG: VOC family protein [Pseudomonadota bacterium]
MVILDHLILRVRDPAASARFYQEVLGFRHEGRAGPFELVRVNEGLTLDLMGEAPRDPVHLAFCLNRANLDAVHRRLVERSIAFGSAPFDRSGGPLQKSQGARGMADAWYFYDPDGHNLEVRSHEPATHARQELPSLVAGQHLGCILNPSQCKSRSD